MLPGLLDPTTFLVHFSFSNSSTLEQFETELVSSCMFMVLQTTAMQLQLTRSRGMTPKPGNNTSSSSK